GRLLRQADQPLRQRALDVTLRLRVRAPGSTMPAMLERTMLGRAARLLFLALFILLVACDKTEPPARSEPTASLSAKPVPSAAPVASASSASSAPAASSSAATVAPPAANA